MIRAELYCCGRNCPGTVFIVNFAVIPVVGETIYLHESSFPEEYFNGEFEDLIFDQYVCGTEQFYAGIEILIVEHIINEDEHILRIGFRIIQY